MMLQKRSCQLFGAMAACCVIGVACWFHVSYMYIGSNDTRHLGGFASRKIVAEEMRQALLPLEAEATLQLRDRLNVFRADFMRRFDTEFVPDHDSVISGAKRDALYWWTLASTFDRGRASQEYQNQIQRSLHDKKLSPDHQALQLQDIFSDVSEQFLRTSFNTSGAVFDRALSGRAPGFNMVESSPATLTNPAAGLIKSYEARKATSEVLSQLTKYYVSQKDAMLFAGQFGRRGELACEFAVTVCKQVLAQGYRITREGLKHAGIRIGATAAKAAAIGNAIGIVVLLYEANELANAYAARLRVRSGDIRTALDEGLKRLIASISDETDGEFRKQLKLISEKVIEQQTKPQFWPL